ncbi:MAG: CPBP family glutamic-type intramembrane protease [Rhabdochlamydiaceae bacterium]
MVTILKIVGAGLAGAVGTFLSSKLVEKNGWSLGGLVDDTFNSQIISIFAKYTDCIMQWPIEKIQILANTYINQIDNVSKQQREAARIAFVARTMIAPIIEEIIYRGPQVVGGVALEQFGIHPVISQSIIGICTNIMFALAHTASINDISARLRCAQFSTPAAKGVVLAVTAGCCEGYSGIVASIIAHVFSNLPAAVKKYKQELAI